MSDNLIVLARKIIARVERGTIAPPFKVLLQDATGNVLWEPTPHNCHSNVATWLSNRPTASPKYSRVLGFVVVPPIPVWRPYWDVIAHAVIEAEDGTLMDITPSGAEYVYPFVRHVGTIEEFQMFSDAVSVKVPV